MDKNNKGLVSVIIPIYNVEYYLDKCLESLTCQTYRDLEIILVDDGSTDRCPQICDAWADRDSRIKVIHKQNGGVSDTRNTGLSAASGRYIYFMDSDDFAENDIIEKLLEPFSYSEVDISLCGFYFYKDNKITKVKGVFNNQTDIYDRDEALLMLGANRIESHLWDKLFKAEIIKDIIFPLGQNYEDISVMHKIFLRAKKIANINCPKYFYTQREGSIVTGKNSKNFNDLFGAYMLRYSELSELNSEKLNIAQLCNLTSEYISYCRYKVFAKNYKYIYSFLKKENKKYKFKKYLTRNKKIQWFLNSVGISFYVQYKLFGG